MCGVFLFRFFQRRENQDWIIQFWLFHFRFDSSGLLQNGVLNCSELTVFVSYTLTDHITMFFKLTHSGAYTVHAILADIGKTFCGIVPTIGQRQH